MDHLWLAIVVVGQFAFVGWVIHLVLRAKQTRRRDRIDLHGKILDSFESPEE